MPKEDSDLENREIDVCPLEEMGKDLQPALVDFQIFTSKSTELNEKMDP